MRRVVWFGTAAAVLAFPLATRCQQDSQKPVAPAPPASSAPAPAVPQSGTASTAQVTQSPPHPDSLAAAARRAREEKKEAAKAARVFDNDNLPSGVISTVGTGAEPAPGDNSEGAANGGGAPAGGSAAAPTDEKGWRERFATLRDKLAADEHELEVMQRELSVLDVAMYPDPQKTLQQETTRGDINKKTTDIDKQKKKIDGDKQAIADAEDELRKSGGDSGWAR